MSNDHADVVGTRKGYEWHRRNGIPACDDCLKGHRMYVQRYRDSSQPARAKVKLPLQALVELLEFVPDRNRGHVARVLGDEIADRVDTIRNLPSGGRVDEHQLPSVFDEPPRARK